MTPYGSLERVQFMKRGCSGVLCVRGFSQVELR